MRPRKGVPRFADPMDAVIAQESGGRAGAIGPQTAYGRAQGSSQMLPGTARAMATKLGVDYRPDLMTGTTPEAAQYQRALGEAYLHEGIEKTGSLEGGLHYYHGGPNQALWGPKTQAYTNAVLARMRSN